VTFVAIWPPGHLPTQPRKIAPNESGRVSNDRSHNDRLLTIPDASERLAGAPVTLRRWLREGRIPSVHLGRSRRVRLGDVEAAIRLGVGWRRPTFEDGDA